MYLMYFAYCVCTFRALGTEFTVLLHVTLAWGFWLGVFFIYPCFFCSIGRGEDERERERWRWRGI